MREKRSAPVEQSGPAATPGAWLSPCCAYDCIRVPVMFSMGPGQENEVVCGVALCQYPKTDAGRRTKVCGNACAVSRGERRYGIRVGDILAWANKGHFWLTRRQDGTWAPYAEVWGKRFRPDFGAMMSKAPQMSFIEESLPDEEIPF